MYVTAANSCLGYANVCTILTSFSNSKIFLITTDYHSM